MPNPTPMIGLVWYCRVGMGGKSKLMHLILSTGEECRGASFGFYALNPTLMTSTKSKNQVNYSTGR